MSIVNRPVESSVQMLHAVPQTICIPKRSNALNYCWITTRSVVCIYFAGWNAFVELKNKRTLQLHYGSGEDVERAVACFNSALSVFVSKEDADKNWPQPIGGTIMIMA